MSDAIKPYKGRDAEEAVSKALELYDQGIEVEEAAEKLNVPARSLYRWLATNATDRWHEAQKGRAVADYERARKRREDASGTLNALRIKLDEENVKDPAERNWRLAHAREVLRAADTELDHQKWLLERLLRRLYGQDQAHSGGAAVQINIGIRRDEATVVHDAAPQEIP